MAATSEENIASLSAIVGAEVSQANLHKLLDAADGDLNRAVNFFFSGLLENDTVAAENNRYVVV